ncbi:der [Symbiodinium sp. KB8]|nr:der [Symbiodinium sp. KB8]
MANAVASVRKPAALRQILVLLLGVFLLRAKPDFTFVYFGRLHRGEMGKAFAGTGLHVWDSNHRVDGPLGLSSAAVPLVQYARFTPFHGCIYAFAAYVCWALLWARKGFGSLVKQARMTEQGARSENQTTRNSSGSSSASNSPNPEEPPPQEPEADTKQQHPHSVLAKKVAELLARASTLLPDNDELKALAEKTRLVVTIAGEHSTGKSTIINAILGKEECITSNTQGTTQEVQEFPGDAILVVDTPGLNAPDYKEHEERALDAIHRSDFVFLTLLANKPTSTAADTLLNEVKASKASLIVLVTYWDALKTERSQNECKEQVREFLGSRGFADAKVFYTDAAAAEQARCRKQTCRDVGFNRLQALLEQELSDKSYLFRVRLLSAADHVKAEICTLEREVEDLEGQASKSAGWSRNLGIFSGFGISSGLALLAAEVVAAPVAILAGAGLGLSAAMSAKDYRQVANEIDNQKHRLSKLKQLAKELEELLESLACTVPA